MECRTEDAGSAMDLSGPEMSDTTNMAVQSDAESVVGGRNTPARVGPQQPSTPLSFSPARPKKSAYPPVFKQWKEEPSAVSESGSGSGSGAGMKDEALDLDPPAAQNRIQMMSPPRILSRAERKKQIINMMAQLQNELDRLEQEDAENGRNAGRDGPEGEASKAKTSELVRSYMASGHRTQDPRDGPVPYGVQSPRTAHLEPRPMVNPDGSQSQHHQGLRRHHQHSPDYDRDRNNAAELSASSNIPSPPETVDSPLPGHWIRAGSHDPRSPTLMPSPMLVQPRRGTGGPLGTPRNNGLQKQGLTDVTPIAQRNREAGTRTFQCPQPGCKSKFHRECELR